MNLQSQAAGGILALRRRINGAMQCPLLFEPIDGPWEYLKQRPIRLDSLPSLVTAARFRLKHQIIAAQRGQWGHRLCRVPLNSEGVKARVRRRYERDEAQ